MIFADTSFWFAAGNPRDGHNEAARELGQLHRGRRVLTTNHVIGETWTLYSARLGRWAAMDFVDRLEGSPRVDILQVGADLEAEAWAWLRRHDERHYSFVDATSFAVMRRHGITRALAFDGHFAAAGFEVLTTSA